MKVSVLSGGILPDREEGRHKKKKKRPEFTDDVFWARAKPQSTTELKDYSEKKKVAKCLEDMLRHRDGKYGRHVSVRAYQKIQIQQ